MDFLPDLLIRPLPKSDPMQHGQHGYGWSRPCLLPSPTQHHGVELAGDFNETGARCRVNLLQGVTNRVRTDHSAFLHQYLGGLQPALAVGQQS